MTSLLALFCGYLLAVLLGKRARRIGPGILFTLGIITLFEVVVVVVNMFLMEMPSAGPGGQ